LKSKSKDLNLEKIKFTSTRYPLYLPSLKDVIISGIWSSTIRRELLLLGSMVIVKNKKIEKKPKEEEQQLEALL
jgi:hypothetical protein